MKTQTPSLTKYQLSKNELKNTKGGNHYYYGNYGYYNYYNAYNYNSYYNAYSAKAFAQSHAYSTYYPPTYYNYGYYNYGYSAPYSNHRVYYGYRSW